MLRISSVGALRAATGVVLIVAFVTALGSPVAIDAQTATRKTFEVASVRLAAPFQTQVETGRLRAEPTITDSRAEFRFISLTMLIANAYRVRGEDVVGPEWMRTERFDVQGTYPSGASKEDVPEMLQSLLAQRFNLKTRRGEAMRDVYVLVTSKDGHRLQRPVSDTGTGTSSDEPADRQVAGVEVRQDPRGGLNVANRFGQSRMSQTQSGSVLMEYDGITMPQFAEILSTYLDRTVIDATALAGTFQAAFEVREDELPARALSTGASAAGAGASLPVGATVIRSVQRFGLNLESRKVRFEAVVVEHVDRKPTED